MECCIPKANATIAVLAAFSGLAACADSRSAAVGERLYKGDPPLTARLSGDPLLLPVEATRCSNCHEAAGLDVAGFGPKLTAASLLSDRKRRGGPPSHYDLKSFCAVLRTGIDPAFVLIDRAMPRYELNEDACKALWDYVKSRS